MSLMHCSLFEDGETNMTTQVKVTARAGQVWSDGHTHYTIDALQATGHGTVWDNGTDGRWVLVQDVPAQETPNYHNFGAAGGRDYCDKCGIAASTVLFGGAEVQRCTVKPTEPACAYEGACGDGPKPRPGFEPVREPTGWANTCDYCGEHGRDHDRHCEDRKVTWRPVAPASNPSPCAALVASKIPYSGLVPEGHLVSQLRRDVLSGLREWPRIDGREAELVCVREGDWFVAKWK